MSTRLTLQVAGHKRIEREIVDALNTTGYDHLRILVAFARWSGVFQIQTELEHFAKRGNIDVVVGVDLGGTTAETLEYLMGLANTRVWVFRSGVPHVVFHPKAYAFTGTSGWLTVIGSSNLTTGGLFTNVELNAVVTGTARQANPFDPVWAQVTDPQYPIKGAHVTPLDKALLDELAPSLDEYTRKPPDRAPKSATAIEPIEIDGAPRQPGRPPDRRHTPPKPQRRGRATVPPAALLRDLYMEVWEETGGGTQVQFPKAAIEEYFGVTLGQIAWVKLKTPSGIEKQRVQVFSNSTFRIPLRFLDGVKRPAVIRMRRIGPDYYSVVVRRKSEAGYAAWLKRCDRRTNSGSKRFGMS